MNKDRRKKINKIYEQVEAIKSEVERLKHHALDIQKEIDDVLEQEQESFDNLPERLQESDNGQRMQDAINYLESAKSDFSNLVDQLDEAQDLTDCLESLDNASAEID